MLRPYEACPAFLESILESADSILRPYEAWPASLFCAVCAVLESIWEHADGMLRFYEFHKLCDQTI